MFARMSESFDPLRFCPLPQAETGDRNAMIAEAAYFRAQRHGFTPGHELEDWIAAEKEIDALLSGAPPVATPGDSRGPAR
jgi:aryl-alcohol dehydrogenase-like predicted oxidoreductase